MLSSPYPHLFAPFVCWLLFQAVDKAITTNDGVIIVVAATRSVDIVATAQPATFFDCGGRRGDWIVVVVVIALWLIALPSPVIPHHVHAYRCQKGRELSNLPTDFPMADCCVSGRWGHTSWTLSLPLNSSSCLHHLLAILAPWSDGGWWRCAKIALVGKRWRPITVPPAPVIYLIVVCVVCRCCLLPLW